jgi:hypothetical protein
MQSLAYLLMAESMCQLVHTSCAEGDICCNGVSAKKNDVFHNLKTGMDIKGIPK